MTTPGLQMRCDKAQGGCSGLTTVNQLINHFMSLGKTVRYMDAIAIFCDLLHCP